MLNKYVYNLIWIFYESVIHKINISVLKCVYWTNLRIVSAALSIQQTSYLLSISSLIKFVDEKALDIYLCTLMLLRIIDKRKAVANLYFFSVSNYVQIRKE